jgi:hypothetical protein
MLDHSVYFQVLYEGPALDANEMDATELAPALMSFAELLQEANEVINGKGTKVQVNVRASFTPGSFGIDFGLVLTIYQALLGALNSDQVTAATHLLALIGLKGHLNGLLQVLLRIGGRPIEKIEVVDDRTARITITRADTIEFDSRILPMLKSPKLRKAVDDTFVRPLRREGVTSISTKCDGDEFRVGKDQIRALAMPVTEDEPLSQSESEAYLQVVSLSFQEDRKWRFTRGQEEGAFYATIQDDEFLAHVARSESAFAKNDILRVLLRTTNVLSDKGLKSEYIIVKVLDHFTGARQLRLSLVDP